jgi:deoxyribonuclease-4
VIHGAHESVSGGLFRAFDFATVDGARAVQIFTKNSNMWREPILAEDVVQAFRRGHAAWSTAMGFATPTAPSGRGTVMAHTSYLINLATDKEDILEKSKTALVAEIERSSTLGIAYVVLHPGAHLGVGEDKGLTQVAAALDEVHERTRGRSAKILLENTAGQGTCVGCTFEHLGAIFDQTKERDRLGVCLDTQHAFAAGYDLSTPEGYESTWAAFEKHVGLGRLLAFHLNDSKKALGSRVDRHEHVGEGILGLPFFWRLLNDARFADVPGVIEIEPRDPATPYKQDVDLLSSLVGGEEPKPKADAPAAFALELSPAPKSAKKR